MSSLAYMPRLDGLRAVAVFGVLIEHWIPITSVRALSPGGVGVTLFFVLSGYLITRILMGYREQPVVSAAGKFYWRRFLRLSPAFYAAIAAGLVFNVLLMREYWSVNVLYLTNFQLGLSGEWTGGADHFWSLCVEEQFYLIWFFVVVALPARYLTPAIMISLATTLVFRAVVYFWGLPPLTTVLLPGNLGSLAIGALLAQSRATPDLRWLSDIALKRGPLMGTAFAVIVLSLSMRYFRLPSALSYPFIVSAFSVCLVAVASSGLKDKWFGWLEWAPLVHIGEISYGIYIYHLFVPQIAAQIPSMEWLGEPSWRSFACSVIITFVVSHASWKYFEKPILRFKDRVPFARREESQHQAQSGRAH